MVGRMIKVGRK